MTAQQSGKEGGNRPGLFLPKKEIIPRRRCDNCATVTSLEMPLFFRKDLVGDNGDESTHRLHPLTGGEIIVFAANTSAVIIHLLAKSNARICDLSA